MNTRPLLNSTRRNSEVDIPEKHGNRGLPNVVRTHIQALRDEESSLDVTFLSRIAGYIPDVGYLSASYPLHPAIPRPEPDNPEAFHRDSVTHDASTVEGPNFHWYQLISGIG